VSNPLLDLEDVGRFFTKKMEDGDLEVASLSTTGFDLLSSYFLSSNEQAGTIRRVEEREAKGSYPLSSDTYSYSYGNQKKKEENEIQFEVLVNSNDLLHLEIAWNLALQTEKDSVVPRAVDFLIRLYSCFSEEQEGDRLTNMD